MSDRAMAIAAKALEELSRVRGGVETAAGVLVQLEQQIGRAHKKREHFLRRPDEPELTAASVPDPSGPLYTLGELVAVAYRARKDRGGRLVDYEHAFERRPLLVANQADRLIIAGGSYRITSHGIEG